MSQGQKHRMAEQSFREQARKSPKSQRIAELSAKKENYGVPLWDHQNGPAGGLTDLGEKEIFHHLYEQNKLGPMNLTSMKNKRGELGAFLYFLPNLTARSLFSQDTLAHFF